MCIRARVESDWSACRHRSASGTPCSQTERRMVCKKNGVCGGLSVAADQLYVAQQWSLEQFLLRDQVKRPALGGGVLPGHRELALSERFCQPIGRFDLDEPLLAAGHLHQEIGHDVAATRVGFLAGPHVRRGFEQLDVRVLPCSRQWYQMVSGCSWM